MARAFNLKTRWKDTWDIPMETTKCGHCGLLRNKHTTLDLSVLGGPAINWPLCPNGGNWSLDHMWQDPPENESAARPVQLKKPDKCPGCGAPAYFGFNDVECSVSCRPQYTRR